MQIRKLDNILILLTLSMTFSIICVSFHLEHAHLLTDEF